MALKHKKVCEFFKSSVRTVIGDQGKIFRNMPKGLNIQLDHENVKQIKVLNAQKIQYPKLLHEPSATCLSIRYLERMYIEKATIQTTFIF